MLEHVSLERPLVSRSPATRNDLTEARDIFRQLLRSPTKETDWQTFFSSYPYVLSTTLPLSLRPDDIRPLARPGRSEPDFIFYRDDSEVVPTYGVVELKRPTSMIITRPRRDVAILTRDARTAVEQGRSYGMRLGAVLAERRRSVLFLGNSSHIFVIMGLQRELTDKLGNEVLRQSLEGQLPPNLQLFPYDTLLQMFEAEIPALMVLVPDLTSEDSRSWDPALFAAIFG